ncbi:MAG TPA: DUF2071 domain-containing protein [Terriglobales bacterium]|jgi:hypothetical protein|nr:DUF2071 domain-containing protein [Terriglobales bacterium]
MLHLLKRHPFPVEAFFRHSLVLTYAFPQQLLRPLLPPELALDTYKNFGFLAIALVQTENLRPAFVPVALGQNFFLSGYRIFTRMATASNSIRGLRILRSDTDKRLMVISGNLLTHYAYQHCQVSFQENSGELRARITTPNAYADLDVCADIAHRPAPLPEGTPFDNEKDARKFAGPLPYTFDYEKETGAIILIRGVRQNWNPQPVRVNVNKCTFFKQSPFCEAIPILANAFYLHDVPYCWERGVRRKVEVP